MSFPTPPLPRVTIQFCTQCKWLLRAAYFAQELLSTFSTSLGEVALQPSTGGTFIVKLYHAPTTTSSEDEVVGVQEHVLWDRKVEGGFPETKELKRRVRDVIDPSRDLGHVDGEKEPTKKYALAPNPPPEPSATQTEPQTPSLQTAIVTIPINSTPNSNQEPNPNRNLTSGSNSQPEFPPSTGPTTPTHPATTATPSQPQANEGEILNSRGKIVFASGGSAGEGFCRPGDEGCEDCG